jgi:hypothetical protein
VSTGRRIAPEHLDGPGAIELDAAELRHWLGAASFRDKLAA